MKLTLGYPYVGQNMADKWNSENSINKDVEEKVQSWYNEVPKSKKILIVFQC